MVSLATVALLVGFQAGGAEAIRADADNCRWLATLAISQDFLAATAKLPEEKPRKLYRHAITREWFTEAEYNAANPATKPQLQEHVVDGDRFYQTKYGSPLTYLPMMEILGQAGVSNLKGKRILDFGYGMIGQLRLWALMGADAVGVDVDPFLAKLYSSDSDQGRLGAGSVKLVHGFFPTDAAVRSAIGGNYDLIVSKNTLKLGYIHPRREAPKAQLIDLGVSDEAFVRELWNRLRAGGYVLVYNISPAQNPIDRPYIPWADGETAFARSVWEKQGFEVGAFDQRDDERCRALFKSLGYDQGPNGREDLRTNTFTHYSLFRRPAR